MREVPRKDDAPWLVRAPRADSSGPSEPAAEQTQAPVQAAAASGEHRLGRYRLERVLGAGGMGVVHEAWDEVLRRRVAVKVLAPRLRGPQALERFQQEATLAGRLRHPSIVVIHEAGEVEGRAFIAMELVEGKSLEDEIDARLGDDAALEGPAREAARRAAVAQVGPDEVRRLCAVARDVARALECGHTYVAPGQAQPSPIIHRDVKPANIMVDAHGTPRLLDYGLAKEAGVALTVTREALGTPLYMSPEQLFSAKRVGPRSDVYSLGMTLYACLTLARPFELSQPGRLFEHLLHDEPVDPARLNPALPDDVRTILLTATAKDERARYASAAAFADDLAAFLEGRPIRARPPTRLARARRLARRHWRLVAAAVVLLGAAVGLTVARLAQERHDLQARAEEASKGVEARSKARQRALERFSEARLVFELAARSKAEDPDGDRWLSLLNEAHGLERLGAEEAAQAGGADVELRRRMLLARIARDDRKAVAELARLHAEAQKAAARLPELDLALRVVEPLVADATSRESRQLFQALCEVSFERYAGQPPPIVLGNEAAAQVAALEAAVGKTTRAAVLQSPWAEPAAALGRLLEHLRQARATAYELARAEPSLRQGQGPSGQASVVVAARAGVDTRDLVVTAHARQDGGLGPALARGACGEVLRVAATGDLVLQVSDQGGAAVRLPVQVRRPTWGSRDDVQRVSLPASPREAPDGMVLVTGARPLWIDRAEVTCGEYRRFLAEVQRDDHARCPSFERRRLSGRSHEPEGLSGRPDDAPVTGLDWYDASAFAAYAGKRLPTAEEWAAAAHGPFAPTLAGANLRGVHDGHLWVAPTRDGPGHVAPCGARDLVGNVAEWLASSEGDDFPVREAAGGGYSDAGPAPLRLSPEARGADVGLRCARDVAQVPAAAAPLTARRVSERDGATMLLVAGGQHEVGGGPGRTTRLTVQLSPFYVDVAPVTNGQFGRFVAATGLPVSTGFAERLLSQPDAPVVEVTWEQARRYAAWAGRRLPTEAEWEVAQRQPGLSPSTVDEWCADTWHPDFFRYANLLDPVNVWTPEDGHVSRSATRRARKGASAGFRCVADARAEEDE